MRRKGFTILEVLVMSAIALVIMGVAWSVFSAMTSQSKKLDTRLRALQASQLVLERLKADIKQHVSRPGEVLFDPASPKLMLKVYRDYVFNPASRGQHSVVVDQVDWTFNPETHQLIRGTEPLKFAQFESITFSVKETAPGSREYGNSVTVDGVYVPEELLATPERITERDRIKWRATIALPHRTLAEAYGFWQENAFDKVAGP